MRVKNISMIWVAIRETHRKRKKYKLDIFNQKLDLKSSVVRDRLGVRIQAKRWVRIVTGLV